MATDKFTTLAVPDGKYLLRYVVTPDGKVPYWRSYRQAYDASGKFGIQHQVIACEMHDLDAEKICQGLALVPWQSGMSLINPLG